MSHSVAPLFSNDACVLPAQYLEPIASLTCSVTLLGLDQDQCCRCALNCSPSESHCVGFIRTCVACMKCTVFGNRGNRRKLDRRPQILIQALGSLSRRKRFFISLFTSTTGMTRSERLSMTVLCQRQASHVLNVYL